MKRVLLAASAALLVGAVSSPAFALDSTVTATILDPVDIIETQPIQYGNIIAGTAGGSVSIAAAANSDVTWSGTPGDPRPVAANQGQEGAFEFDGSTVVGAPTFTVTIPASIDLDTTPTSGDPITMTVTVAGDLTNLQGENHTALVGGSLALSANHPPGNYAGTLAVTATYD